MKAKKLICLALPIMLLGVGCSTSKDHLKESVSSETTTEPSTETASAESTKYENALYELEGEWYKAETSRNNAVVGDANYKAALNKLMELSFKFEELKPDSKSEETHKKIVNSMELMREGIELQLANMNNKRNNDYSKAESKMIEATSIHSQAFRKWLEVVADKEALETANKEGDKIHKEKDELEKKEKTEEASKEVVREEESNKKVVKESVIKEPVIKESGIKGTLSEERENKDKDMITEVHAPLNMGQYKEKIDTLNKQFIDAIQATQPIVANDTTLKTNQAELKKQFEIVKEQLRKLKDLAPPKEYDYYQTQLRDDVKAIEMTIDQVFVGLDEKDDEKAVGNFQAIFKYIATMNMTLDEISKTEG
ncbi:hypothetical protein P4U03_16775 [Bacillus mycoides]|uniref:Lipoprotein n=1 Tax=Bacillus thuringiensis serovar navarrensis TaxID=339658 RepID=A0A243A5A6_BACTU|nr:MULTISPECIES: hypothetical protein [Bacillus cereus group]MED1268235.1 hypothetical protein [Bacillus mycoides]OTY12425.1 hypothetical protein BK732_27485 [Bacillus thuringiensis serovar navarrensis]